MKPLPHCHSPWLFRKKRKGCPDEVDYQLRIVVAMALITDRHSMQRGRKTYTQNDKVRKTGRTEKNLAGPNNAAVQTLNPKMLQLRAPPFKYT